MKKFLHILKLAFRGANTSEVLKENDPLKTLKHCDLEKPRTEMRILSRADYPMKKSFSRSLEKLTITGCALRRFDTRILDLTRLYSLDLSNNQLTSLPDDISSLVALKQLYLNKNQFEYFPKCILNQSISKSLTVLELCDNALKFIPPKLSSLKELVTLRLDRNNIQCLQGDIGTMTKMRYLTVAENQLKFVPWSFQLLNLMEVDVSDNLFHVDFSVDANSMMVPKIPSLFELLARFIVCRG